MDYKKRVIDFIKLNNLLNNGDNILLCLSGGADSCAMTYLFDEIKDEFNLTLYACHIHHGIRGKEADSDLEYASYIAKKLNIPFFKRYVDVLSFCRDEGVSIEEGARILRYKEIFDIADYINNKSIKIATAHNKNDNAETVLFNLVRGSGLKGMSGINKKNIIDNKVIIRPLLSLYRSEIEEYLNNKNVDFKIDSTNKDVEYARNAIRNIILPDFISMINKQTISNINNAAEFINAAYDYIYDEANKLYLKYAHGPVLYIDALKEEKEVLRTYVIRIFLEKNYVHMKDITATHIRSIDRLLFNNANKSIDIKSNLKVKKSYNYIFIEGKNIINDDRIKKNIEINAFKCTKIEFDKSLMTDKKDDVEYVNFDVIQSIQNEIRLRNVDSDDYIHIKNGKKKIKALLCDEKIPIDYRKKIVVLAHKNRILCIPFFRLDYNLLLDINKNNNVAMKINFIKS